MVITLSLPKPPSVNHLYGYTSRGGHARSYITKEGKAWFEEAGYLARTQSQLLEPIESKVTVSIKLFTAYAQDADNITKGLLDLISKHTQIIKNDLQVYKLIVEKFPCKKTEQRVEVTIIDYC